MAAIAVLYKIRVCYRMLIIYCSWANVPIYTVVCLNLELGGNHLAYHILEVPSSITMRIKLIYLGHALEREREREREREEKERE